MTTEATNETEAPCDEMAVAVYIQPGDTVQASVPDGDPVKGEVVSVTTHGVFVKPDDGGPVFGAVWKDVVLNLEDFEPAPVL
jgi:hypothetical protein